MLVVQPKKGSVSAVFHEIWDPNRGIVHKYIIHVDPKEKNIKITPLNPAYGRTKIVIDGLDMPLGLAVDPYSNNVYWTDQGTFSIGVASLEAALKGQIKSNKLLYTSKYLGVPRYIAVDPIRRALYWSERQDDWERIHKSDILGKSQDIIWHEFGTLDIGSISVELSTGRICWHNILENKMESIDRMGSNHLIDARDVTNKAIWMALNNFTDKEIEEKSELIYQALMDVGNISWVDFYDGQEYAEQMLKEFPGEMMFPCSAEICDEVCIADQNDEPYCTGTCQSWEWLCRKSNVCIQKNMVCDGYDDCEEGEDEIEGCPFDYECPKDQFRCKHTGRCLDFRDQCDGKIDCRDESDEANCPERAVQECNFNSGICEWEPKGIVEWKISHVGTPSQYTGPILSMNNTNRYIYMEATDANEGDSALLVSNSMSYGVCFTFKYFLHGSDIGSLRVLVWSDNELSSSADENDDETSTTLVWEITGDQGQYWRTEEITINPALKVYRIVIEATRGKNFKSDIAIDDVRISPGVCQAAKYCPFDDTVQCHLNRGQLPNFNKYYSWEHEFGEIIQNNPLGSHTGNTVKKNDSGTVTTPWKVYNFKVDKIEDCSSECMSSNSMKLVRERHTANGKLWIGVILCNNEKPDEYKIFLSDSLTGVFRHIVHPARDICDLVDGEKKLTGDHTSFCRAELAYRQKYDSYQLTRHDLSTPESGFRTLRSSFCINTSLPDMVHQSEEYHYHIASAWGTGSKQSRVTVFTYPVERMTVPQNETIVAVSNTSLKLRHWCLTVSYSIIFSSELIISIDGNLIWSSEGITTGPYREKISINIPEPITSYDITFTALVERGKSGAVLIDEIRISEKACYKRQKSCGFEEQANDCFFSIDRGQLIYIYQDKLYNKGLFEPDIIANDDTPGFIVTSPDDGSYNFDSDLFFIAKPYYNQYCVVFKYKKKAGGVIRIELSLDVGGKSEVIYDHMLRPANVSPWIEVAVDLERTEQSMGRLSYHALPETYLAYMKLENGKCPEKKCNGRILCNNGLNCVDPNELCDTKNNCGDWSDERGCESWCGDKSEHYEMWGTLGNKPKHQSCLWRIHGLPNKRISLSITTYADTNQIDGIWFFDGLHNIETEGGNFIRLPKNVTSQVETEYFIDSNTATIIIDFELAEMLNDGKIAQMPLIKYRQVDEDYCSHICDNGQCLKNNYACDGVPGCDEGKDEVGCLNSISLLPKMNIDTLHVTTANDDWQIVCFDTSDVNYDLANLACYQLGFWSARSYEAVPYVGRSNRKFSRIIWDPKTTFIQGMVESTDQCKFVWKLECARYECGTRKVKFRAQTRIIGGNKSQLGKWPWLVSFQKRGTHNCGGTLVSDKFVLTAAHCFDEQEEDEHTVLLGTNDLNNPIVQQRKILKTVIHENYDPMTLVPLNDIALVLLDRKVDFNEYLQPICMTPPAPNFFKPGTKCTLAGWGKLKNGSPEGFPLMLHDVQTPIIPTDKCGVGEYARFEYTTRKGKTQVNQNQICAGKLDTGGYGVCNGDSGGPLMCEDNGTYFITGIVSWSRGCAEKNAADVLTNVEEYLPWISKTIQDSFKVKINPPGTPSSRVKHVMCDGRKTSSKNGIILSQGWPKEYKPNLNCKIIIQRMSANIIKVEPEYFALPDTPARSKMTFYDGSITTGEKLAEYYGSGGFDNSAFNEPLIFGGTGDLVIQFTSGPNKQWLNWGGFKLRYSLLDSLSDSLDIQSISEDNTCGGEYHDNNGRLHFTWPSTKTPDETTTLCTWIINAPPSGQSYDVTINSDDVSLTSGSIYTWLDAQKPENSVKENMFTTNEKIIIQFEGYDKSDRSDFEIFWSLKEIEKFDISKVVGSCSKTFSESMGAFASPGYPNNYPDNTDCSWKIEADPGQVISLEFSKYDVEEHYDLIKIQSIVTGVTKDIGLDESMTTIESLGTTIIEFNSDASTNKSGFLIKYRIDSADAEPTTTAQPETTEVMTTASVIDLDELPEVKILTENCQFTTSINNGVRIIRSPGYPKEYPKNIECKWEISLDDDTKMMQLYFLNFMIEYIKSCTYDRLIVDDDGVITKLCGQLNRNIQPKYNIYNSKATLTFKSDQVKNDKGFEVEIRVVDRPPTTQPPASVVYQCNFDFGPCGFHNGDDDSNYNWLRTRDSTPSEDTGPPYDVNQSGHYMYFEASDRKQGDIGRLWSKKMQYKGDANNERLDLDPHCLQFQFDMFGKDMGELNLYVIQDNLKSLVWNHKGQSRKSKESTPWEQVSLTFYPYADYEFVFEAISGSAYRSDIAIDNIVVSQNMCTLCEGDGLFDCQSSKSQCILQELVCDGMKDCDNGLDENDCLPEKKLEEFEDFCLANGYEHLPACREDSLIRNCFNSTSTDVICDEKWDCLYGYDEAGCQEVSSYSLSESCGLPDPEPRHANMGWAKGRAKFEENDHRWLWTGALFYKSKFQCSVHMVENNWYITSLDCVRRGIYKIKRNSNWYDYRGCSLKQNGGSNEKRVDAEHFEIQHRNLHNIDQKVTYYVDHIHIHPSDGELDSKTTMVLIKVETHQNNARSETNDSRRRICLNSEPDKRFRFDTERPQLCYVVGYRGIQNEKIHKWQSMVPVKQNSTEDLIYTGYRMLLISPFKDDRGAGLFCQSWNQQWHLTGIIRENAESSTDWPSQRAGVTTFVPISHLASWVQRECPGQFICQRSRTCIDLKHVCDGQIDCDDASDEKACSSGCGSDLWLPGNTDGVIHVNQEAKTCTWIYEQETGSIGTFAVDQIIAEGSFDIIVFDSIDEKWTVYNDYNPVYLSSKKSSYVTLRVNLAQENALLNMKIKYYKENQDSCGADRYKCKREDKCISKSFLCNGYENCDGGDDEDNCINQCEVPRYTTANDEPQTLTSRNYPGVWLGRGECATTIRTKNGNGILLNVDLFVSHESDYVDVYEGSSCDEKLLKRLSGTYTEPILIQSTFDIVTIYTYNSDLIYQRRYSIQYSEMP